MLFKSTINPSHKVNFKEAFMQGICPFKGLYIPEQIPRLPIEFWDNLDSMSNQEIAFKLLSPYLIDEIGQEALTEAVAKTFHFPFPLVALSENIYTMELFHGPTLAFKDVGAQFMAEMHRFFNAQSARKITVLVATSGDTGGAVAQSFFGMDNVEVVILYPKGKVSPIQELQLTALGGNIHACAVLGDFDKCQAMVKKAFSDTDLQELSLTSANSINVARWLPQMVYYALIYKELKNKNKEIVVSVPSGNFGNLAAGLLATAMGLPIANWLAATNINDTVPHFLTTGEWNEKETKATISNAMDVSAPSNFVRIQQLKEFWQLNGNLLGASCTDVETKQSMKFIFEQFQYIADPHGAVGFKVLNDHLKDHTSKIGVFMETAHPIKFPEVVQEAIPSKIPIPQSIESLTKKTGSFKVIADDIALKNFLLKL